MVTFAQILRTAKNVPLEFKELRNIVGDRADVGFKDHESLSPHMTPAEICGKHDCVAIMVHILNAKTHKQNGVNHWVGLIKNGKKFVYFDPLGLSLAQLYRITMERPTLEEVFKGHHVEMSTTGVQRFAENVRDCTMHVAVRFCFPKWTNAKYYKFIKSSRISTDDTVTMMTLLHLLREDLLPAKV